jgi:putative flippase GtrA
MIKKMLHNPLALFYSIKFKFIRFLFVGLINTLFSLTIYWILIYFGLHYSLAVFISNMLGVLFNFKTTGKLVFENSSNKLLFKFFAVYLFTYGLSVGSLKLLFLVHVDKYLAAALIALPMAGVSFLLMKAFVFKNKNDEPQVNSGGLN